MLFVKCGKKFKSSSDGGDHGLQWHLWWSLVKSASGVVGSVLFGSNLASVSMKMFSQLILKLYKFCTFIMIRKDKFLLLNKKSVIPINFDGSYVVSSVNNNSTSSTQDVLALVLGALKQVLLENQSS